MRLQKLTLVRIRNRVVGNAYRVLSVLGMNGEFEIAKRILLTLGLNQQVYDLKAR